MKTVKIGGGKVHRVQSLILVLAAMSLLTWAIYLINVLPISYRVQHWKVAWIGFDLGMTCTFLATSWAFWKKRQAAIQSAMVSATLLIVDSWFDVVTSNPGWDQKIAIAFAIFLEIPAALLLFRFSRRAVRKSIQNVHVKAGRTAKSVSPWRIPLTIFDDEENV